jgi:hypothetical protein
MEKRDPLHDTQATKRHRWITLGLVAGIWAWGLARHADPSGVLRRIPWGWFLAYTFLSLAIVAAMYLSAARDSRERLQRRRRIVVAAVAACVAIIVCEIPVLFGWIDYRAVFATDGLSTIYNPRYRLDRELIGLHEPHDRFQGLADGDLVHRLGIETDRRYEIDVRWDANGFRNSEDVDQADVVLIGDSYLEAVLVSWDQTVTARLAQALGRPVLNLGHGGFGPQQQLAALRRFGFPARPKTIVWFFYEGNDLENYRVYEAIQADWDGWVTREHGFLKRTFTRNAGLALGRLLTSSPSNSDRAAARSAILIPPAARAGETIYFGYRCEPLSLAEQAALSGTLQVLATANAECRDRGIRLVLAFVPVKWRVYRELVRPLDASELATWRTSDLNQRLGQWAAGENIHFADLTQPLSIAALDDLVYYLDDAHWTGAGHACVASALGRQL